MTDDRIAEIQARADKATPGPWVWRGNMDYEDPRLVGRNRVGEDGRRQFPGMIEVLWSYPRDREKTDPGANEYREYLQYATIHYRDDDGIEQTRSYTAAEIEALVESDWLTDAWGEPIRDSRMCFTTEHMTAADARELAVFEVAPNATTRQDLAVYRADIIDVRHPDADFIAHSRDDLVFLLAEIDRLRAQVAELEAISKGKTAKTLKQLRRAQVAESAIARVEALFAGGPDTSIRTTWHDGVEYWEVPAAEMQEVLFPVTETEES